MKRYVRESGAETVRALLRRPSRRLAASALSGVEVPAAFWRRARERDLSVDQARRLAQRAVLDLRDAIVVEVRRPVLDRAARLVEARPLRAYDAVQLASAVVLAERTAAPLTFVCADNQLTEAAGAEGLRVLRV